MKIRHKIALSLLIELFFIFCMSLAVYEAANSIYLSKENAVISKTLILTSTDFRAQVRNRLMETFKLFLVNDTSATDVIIQKEKTAIENKIKYFQAAIEEDYFFHKDHIRTDVNEVVEFYDVLAVYRELDQKLNEAVLLWNSNKKAAAKIAFSEASDNIFHQFIKKITIIIDQENQEALLEANMANHKIAFMKKISVWLLVFALIFAFVVIVWINKSIIMPLQRLDEATQNIGAGNFELALIEKGTDELAHLSQAFNKMSLSLKMNREALEVQQQTIFESSKLSSLGEMARGVAHEINSPLAAIVISAEMIEFKNSKLVPPSPDISKLAKSIQDAGGRIEKIVKGLKGFSRQSHEIDQESFTVRQLLDKTLALCGEMLKANNVKLIIDDENLDILLHGKNDLLSQSLLNLITNSFECVSKLDEKWIKLEARIKDYTIELRVIDSGKGISEEVRKKMFRPMFTTKPIGSGPGLGLSISRSIVSNFGGNILYDETSNHTCFVMSLPYNGNEGEV